MIQTQTAAAPIPRDTLERCARALRVLAHPDRLRIVEILHCDSHRPGNAPGNGVTVGDLANSLKLAPNAVSQHLNHMKAHGLLASLRRGRTVYYRVTSPHAVTVINCIRTHGVGQ